MAQKTSLNTGLKAGPFFENLLVARPHIQNLVDRLRKELLEVKAITYGRPLRYYDAYRSYTIYFNITQLESLIRDCTPPEKEIISQLLKQYNEVTD